MSIVPLVGLLGTAEVLTIFLSPLSIFKSTESFDRICECHLLLKCGRTDLDFLHWVFKVLCIGLTVHVEVNRNFPMDFKEGRVKSVMNNFEILTPNQGQIQKGVQ